MYYNSTACVTSRKTCETCSARQLTTWAICAFGIRHSAQKMMYCAILRASRIEKASRRQIPKTRNPAEVAA
eukprot:scaffold53_cov193-Pinguiococcus_pyrenoidosus.AAC.76